MLQDEMEILRAVSVKLDEDTVFVLTYQYHTEKDPSDPDGKKKDRSKSRYRMLGRIEKTQALQDRAAACMSDAERLGPWKWTDDPGWDGRILYSKDNTNRAKANWLDHKVRKAVDWDTYLKIVAGYKKCTDRKSKDFGKYTVLVPGAVYQTEGYSCSDGSTVSVADREALLSKAGQNVWFEIRMKLVGRNPAA